VIHHPDHPGRRDLPSRRPARALAALAAAVALAAPAAAPAAAAATPDHLPTQWHRDARAEPLLTAPPPAERPVICIVDSGVHPTPDLDIVSRVALDGGTVDDITARDGHYGHGTSVAHMAAGKVNGWGGAGVFPHARIASVRIFNEPGEPVPWQEYIGGIEKCRYVRPTPVVVVLSVGGPAATDTEAAELTTKILQTRDRHDMTVVAAAGNGGGPTDMPAGLTASFAAAASTTAGELCGFSARGENVDVAAPGCDLQQAGWDGKPWTLQGTSFAAPLAAGALAALRAYQPNLTALQAEQLLLSTARPGPFPLIDVSSALMTSGASGAAVVEGHALKPAPPPDTNEDVQDPLAPGSHVGQSSTTDARGGDPSDGPPSPSTVPTSAAPPSTDSSSLAPVPAVTAAPAGALSANAQTAEASSATLALPAVPMLRWRESASAVSPARFARPRARLTRFGRHSMVRVSNRPAGSKVQVRVGTTRVTRRAGRFLVPGHPSVVRVRLVGDLVASDWVKVRSRSD